MVWETLLPGHKYQKVKRHVNVDDVCEWVDDELGSIPDPEISRSFVDAVLPDLQSQTSELFRRYRSSAQPYYDKTVSLSKRYVRESVKPHSFLWAPEDLSHEIDAELTARRYDMEGNFWRRFDSTLQKHFNTEEPPDPGTAAYAAAAAALNRAMWIGDLQMRLFSETPVTIASTVIRNGAKWFSRINPHMSVGVRWDCVRDEHTCGHPSRAHYDGEKNCWNASDPAKQPRSIAELYATDELPGLMQCCSNCRCSLVIVIGPREGTRIRPSDLPETVEDFTLEYFGVSAKEDASRSEKATNYITSMLQGDFGKNLPPATTERVTRLLLQHPGFARYPGEMPRIAVHPRVRPDSPLSRYSPRENTLYIHPRITDAQLTQEIQKSIGSSMRTDFYANAAVPISLRDEFKRDLNSIYRSAVIEESEKLGISVDKATRARWSRSGSPDAQSMITRARSQNLTDQLLLPPSAYESQEAFFDAMTGMRITGGSQVIATRRYGEQFDAMLLNWLGSVDERVSFARETAIRDMRVQRRNVPKWYSGLHTKKVFPARIANSTDPHVQRFVRSADELVEQVPSLQSKKFWDGLDDVRWDGDYTNVAHHVRGHYATAAAGDRGDMSQFLEMVESKINAPPSPMGMLHELGHHNMYRHLLRNSYARQDVGDMYRAMMREVFDHVESSAAGRSALARDLPAVREALFSNNDYGRVGDRGIISFNKLSIRHAYEKAFPDRKIGRFNQFAASFNEHATGSVPMRSYTYRDVHEFWAESFALSHLNPTVFDNIDNLSVFIRGTERVQRFYIMGTTGGSRSVQQFYDDVGKAIRARR